MPRTDPDELQLMVDGRAVAPVEIARTRGDRARGLLGRDHLDGVLLLAPAGSVHTIGMRFTIDVALCSRTLEVLAVRTVPPGRLVLPRRGVRAVLEAGAGSWAAWGVTRGVHLQLSER